VKPPFLLLIGIALFPLGGFLSSFESYQTLTSIAVIARLVFLSLLVLARDGRPAATRAHNEGRQLLGRVGGRSAEAAAIVQLLVVDVFPNGSIDGGRATGFTAHPNNLGALTGSPSCQHSCWRHDRELHLPRAWSMSCFSFAAGLIL
jgi:hypothetical protein